MTRTTLHLTLSVPVTYDETKLSEEQAKDVVQGVVIAAVERAIEGRHVGPDGKYLDCHGPELVRLIDVAKEAE